MAKDETKDTIVELRQAELEKNDLGYWNEDHPYVGKPCIFFGWEGIVYGSAHLTEEGGTRTSDVRLAILYTEKLSQEPYYQLLHMLRVKPDDENLYILDAETLSGKRVMHRVLEKAARGTMMTSINYKETG